MEQVSAFTLTLRLDNIGVIVIDVPDEKVNTLKAAFVDQIRDVLQQAREIPRLAGLVILSGKPDSFIAGADIAMIDACTRAEEAELLAQQGQQVMAEIAAMPVPVVAAIHGACLGGGLELALACHRRVCTLDEKTRLGLPEVQLGLLPGSGGTQRLPRIIGVTAALDMILTGRALRPRQALKCGLVDDAVPQAILLDAAIALVRKPRDEKVPLSLRERLLSGPAGRGLLFRLAGQRAQAKSHGNYPAVDKILSVVKQGLEHPQGGYQAEAQAFGELAMTPQSAALRGLFFATTALKKDPGAIATPRALHSVGVLGGGLMGGGIACVTATRAGLAVRVKDISAQGISRAMNTCWQVLSRDVKRRRLTVAERQQQMARMTGGTDYQGFHHRDVIIEAVFENLALKQQMVSEIEAHCGSHTIFASNTSSLPIADIARGAQRPENIIGLHYFSPPEKMPLVEVIPHAGTSDDVVATTVLLAKKQGKTPIVVADRAGFYVNRILAPYIVEAMRCLMEGEPVEHIDAALVKFGFPVGPVQLLDEVGIDVGTHIMPVLQQAWGDRFALPPIFSAILNDNRKGKKNGRGFYLYNQRVGKKKKADAEIYRLLQVTPKSCSGAQDLATRCVMMMLNEAARALDEGVIRSPRDGDIGAVFGIGFPPFLGGPFRYMDSMGIAKVVNVLEELTLRHDARFTPCERLEKMVEEKLTFY